jgi:hypothetical protein
MTTVFSTPLTVTGLSLHAIVLRSSIPETLTLSPGAEVSTVAAVVGGSSGSAVGSGRSGSEVGLNGPPPPEIFGVVGVEVTGLVANMVVKAIAPPPMSRPTTNSANTIQPIFMPGEDGGCPPGGIPGMGAP